MRKFLLAGAVVAGLIHGGDVMAQVQPTTSAPAPTGPQKIAYINSEKLIQQAPGATEARTTVQREIDKYRAELALLEDSINTMIADYNQKQITLSPDAKKKQEEAIRTRQASLQTRSQTYDQSIQKRQQDLLEPVMDRINKALNDYRKDNGISIVLDASARAIISADSSLDITDAILAKLKAASPTPPKKPGS
jgi:outer membrane protein